MESLFFFDKIEKEKTAGIELGTSMSDLRVGEEKKAKKPGQKLKT